jgi:hypothetical protein
MITVKPGDWVRISEDGRVGCVQKEVNGHVTLMIPNEEWPFPTWVMIDIEELSHSRRPAFLRIGKREAAPEEFEAAPF